MFWLGAEKDRWDNMGLKGSKALDRLIVIKSHTYLNKPAGLFKYVWPFVISRHYRVNAYFPINDTGSQT